nr:unnamed protein product [Callosobruchus analis]
MKSNRKGKRFSAEQKSFLVELVTGAKASSPINTCGTFMFVPGRFLSGGTFIKPAANLLPMFDSSKILPSLFFPYPPISTHKNVYSGPTIAISTMENFLR